MSTERDTQTAGAPVDETEATQTEVQAAVERATESTPGAGAQATDTPVAGEPTAHDTAPADQADTVSRPAIAPIVETPSAAPGPSASEIFASSAGQAGPAAAPSNVAPQADEARSDQPAAPQAAALADRLEADAAAAAAVTPAAAAPAAAPGLGPVRDGEIRISADHPMAALYMQTPMPPEIKGNRGAGILIALLATVGFAVVFAGIIALMLAPTFPPSTFLTEGLLPAVLSWSYLGAVAAFFVGLALLVLIAGRAGWWAYVIGGFFVGLLVFAVAFLGLVLDSGEAIREAVGDLLRAELGMGMLIVAVIAGIVAREVTVWFGAWIGSRGRKVTRKNAAAVAEYEVALAEVQAKTP